MTLHSGFTEWSKKSCAVKQKEILLWIGTKNQDLRTKTQPSAAESAAQMGEAEGARRFKTQQETQRIICQSDAGHKGHTQRTVSSPHSLEDRASDL